MRVPIQSDYAKLRVQQVVAFDGVIGEEGGFYARIPAMTIVACYDNP
jgi:hypothetical protein